jgi:LytTR family transcriptional regulator, CO-responsive transcriptional regulator RcoM
MNEITNPLGIGIVLLSPDFHVVGLNDFARRLYGPTLKGLGNSLFDCHSQKSRKKVSALIRKLTTTPPNVPSTMIIDILGKVFLFNLSQLSVVLPAPRTYWSVVIIDVSEQTGAAINPLKGVLEMKRFPVYENGTHHFLDTDTVYSIQSDGDYCRIFIPGRFYYLHLTLKEILQRFTNAAFFMPHRSYVVNLRHVNNMARIDNGRIYITFDDKSVPPVPVSRRRLTAMKKALTSSGR